MGEKVVGGHLNSYMGTLRLNKLKLHVGMFRGQPPRKGPRVDISPSLYLDFYKNNAHPMEPSTLGNANSLNTGWRISVINAPLFASMQCQISFSNIAMGLEW